MPVVGAAKTIHGGRAIIAMNPTQLKKIGELKSRIYWVFQDNTPGAPPPPAEMVLDYLYELLNILVPKEDKN